MVELALVLILLVMLLVGTVSAAVAYGRGNSIQNAVREASRFGATLPGAGATVSWFEDVRDVARAAATGDLDTGTPNNRICVAFVTTDDIASHIVDIDGAHTGIQSGKCPGFDDGRDGLDEARVNVVAQRVSPINAVVFSTDVTLTGEAGARYER